MTTSYTTTYLPSNSVVSVAHNLYLQLNPYMGKFADSVSWFLNSSVIQDLAISGFYSLGLLICTPAYDSKLNMFQVLAHM